MTTIAFRDSIVASDSRAYAGDKNQLGRKNKLKFLDDGRLFGCSTNVVGLPDLIFRLVNEKGTDGTFDEELTAQVIVFNKDGTFQYMSNGKSFSGPIAAEYGAIGSGEEYARGALHAGATAYDAVKAATDLDVWSGGPIQAIHLPWSFKGDLPNVG